MSQPNAATVALVARLQPLVAPIAEQPGPQAPRALPGTCQERAGDPTAIRVERGFWTRYASGIVAHIRNSTTKTDDKWLLYPDLVSASYGLMQVLYVVALERGMVLPFPTSLCDPTTGVEA